METKDTSRETRFPEETRRTKQEKQHPIGNPMPKCGTLFLSPAMASRIVLFYASIVPSLIVKHSRSIVVTDHVLGVCLLVVVKDR